MRDKFRKSSNPTPTGKLDGKGATEPNRSRGREKDRNSRSFRRSQSRSPKRARLTMPISTSRGRDDHKTRLELEMGRQRTDPDGRNRLEYHDKDKSMTSSHGRLRMDNQSREYDSTKRFASNNFSERDRRPVPRDRPALKDDSRMLGSKKGLPPSELDRVMKRAREERSSFWNKKVLEAEEKDPHRWGHSGYKELYRRDMRRSSRSTSPKSLLSKRSVPFDHHHRKSRSRSRSPIQKQAPRHRPGGRTPSPLMSRRIPASKSKMSNRPKTSPFTTSPSVAEGVRDRKKENGLSSKSRSDKDTVGSSAKLCVKGSTQTPKTRMMQGSKRGLETGKKGITRSYRSKSSSVSLSSDSLGSSPYRLQSNKSSSSKNNSFQGKGPSRSQNHKRSDSRSISRSSSSSSSSDDEDVLQLHPKSKGKSRSLSYSDSSSSVSDSSASVKLSTRNKTLARTSSSSSSKSSSSDYDSDVARKGMDRTKKPNSTLKKTGFSSASSGAKKPKGKGTKKLGPSEAESNSSSSDVEEIAVVPRSSTTKAPTKKPAPSRDTSGATKTTMPPKIVTKEKTATTTVPQKSGAASHSGESDSDSDSSSDSVDSEPKMTLSERFAKLTQMSTDKREYAKPVLSVNEIDTKLKVVKDLRNADTKVYVDGPPAAPPVNNPRRVRPKSPEYNEGEKRFTSDERRRHFEKMSKDEPSDRPADWSDTRVRYYYYRDRGYFNDRPLTLEEYIKWEDWWYKYRDWLQSEGILNRMGGGGGGHGQGQGHFSGSGHSGGGGWNHQPPDNSRPRQYNSMSSRRVERMPAPLLSSRSTFGRPENNAYLQNQIPIGRRIGRTPTGSLVVNIRQGNNFGSRDKRVAMTRHR